MRDVIWTIIVIWVVYRIYEAIKSSKVYIYQKHEHNHNYNTRKEGEVKINTASQQHHTERKPNSDKGGEYVDYEEVKD
jgi:uncharacterized protein DUF4834